MRSVAGGTLDIIPLAFFFGADQNGFGAFHPPERDDPNSGHGERDNGGCKIADRHKMFLLLFSCKRKWNVLAQSVVAALWKDTTGAVQKSDVITRAPHL